MRQNIVNMTVVGKDRKLTELDPEMISHLIFELAGGTKIRVLVNHEMSPGYLNIQSDGLGPQLVAVPHSGNVLLITTVESLTKEK